MNLLFFTFVIWVTSFPASAKDYYLYGLFDKKGDYNSSLQNIQAGDVLHVSGNQSYTIRDVLNQPLVDNSNGDWTFVAVIDNGDEVVRLPGGIDQMGVPYSQYFQWSVRALNILQEYGVPVPKINKNKSVSGRSLVVERINQKFDLWQYLSIRPTLLSQKAVVLNGESISPGDVLKYDELLVEFVRRSYYFSEIHDARAQNIITDGERWVLIDAISNFRSGLGRRREPLFSQWGSMPDELKHRFHSAVEEERSKLTLSQCIGARFHIRWISMYTLYGL